MRALLLIGVAVLGIQFGFAATPYQMSGLLGLKGSQVAGELDEANIFGVDLDIQFSHRLNDYLGIEALGGLTLETGESESVYSGRTFKPKNSMNLGHAYVEVNPFKNLALEFGAINQKYHNNPLFLTSTAFVSAREVLSIKLNQWTFELDMIQGIPSNYTLSQKLGNVEEGSSRFFNEKIRVKGEGNVLSMEASVGHFAFDKLNSSVAYASRLLGNTVSGIGSANNRFQNSFVGWNSDVKLSYHDLSFMDISLVGAGHINEKAQSGKNTGLLFGTVLTTKGFDNNVSFSFKNFRNEADSTVAFYSSKYSGQTNRKGMMLGFKVIDSESQLTYGIDSYFTTPIEENPFQEKERIINLSLRKAYDFF